MKALEDARQLGLRDADARVAHRELGRVPYRPERDADLAPMGELEGVGHEVEDDLLPHVPIDEDRLGQRRTVHHELQPRPLARRAKVAGKLGREGGEVGRLVGGLRPSGLDPREVEQRVHEPQQP
jgi:hypothetical protein